MLPFRHTLSYGVPDTSCDSIALEGKHGSAEISYDTPSGLVTNSLPVRLWPHVPLPEPAVAVADVTVTDDGWLRWGPVAPTDPLPMELVIRELLDVTSAEECLAFAKAYGVLTRRHGEVVLGSEAARDFTEFMTHSDNFAARDEELRQAAAARGQQNHLRDLVAYITDAQRLARSWIGFLEDSYIADIWGHDRPAKRTKEGAVSWKHKREHRAWTSFVLALNEGLKSFHARAELVEPELEDWTWGAPTADLYAGLCVQLMNLINEGHDHLNVCANETCRHHFIRQRGGAVHGQFRSTGVLYCTVRCAKTQGQRDLRRRKNEGKSR